MMLCRFAAVAVALIGTSSAQQGCDCPILQNSVFGLCSGSPADPYKCGNQKKCPYGNQCLVNEAGFDRNFDCCQAPRSGSCPTNYDPYVCGGNKRCPYDNFCLAQAAGYSQNQCSRDYNAGPQVTCPSQDCGQCNNVQDDPYNCGPNFQCYYRNLCLVQAAGWNPNSNCRSAGGGGGCPSPPFGTQCPAISEPYRCGNNNCRYDNSCLANAAGWNVNSQCNRDFDRSCPIPTNQDRNWCGNDSSNPIVCSLSGLDCPYDNACLAQSVNFNTQTQCRDIGGQCPVPTNADYNVCRGSASKPLTCGRNNDCPYDNYCLAQRVNFNTNTQCCIVPRNNQCNRARRPVTCVNQGGNSCRYDNICLAQAAGYANSQCRAATTSFSAGGDTEKAAADDETSGATSRSGRTVAFGLLVAAGALVGWVEVIY